MKQELMLFLKSWQWTHWAVLGLVVIMVFHKVHDRHAERVQKISMKDVEIIEEDIKVYNTMAERLGQMEVLPPVKEQWAYAIAIAERYGVDIQLKKEKGYYQGPLVAWNGEFQGATGSVLVAAKEIQETVPAFLYDINIAKANSTIVFSILGSE